MTRTELLEEAKEITAQFSPETKDWELSMSDLARVYFQQVGYSIDAAMEMENVAQIVKNNCNFAESYLTRSKKL